MPVAEGGDCQGGPEGIFDQEEIFDSGLPVAKGGDRGGGRRRRREEQEEEERGKANLVAFIARVLLLVALVPRRGSLALARVLLVCC